MNMFCRSTRQTAVIPHLPFQPKSSMAAWTDFIRGKFDEPKILWDGNGTVQHDFVAQML